MFAMLGDIGLDILTLPSNWEQRSGVTYAPIERLGSKPRLQHTGEALDTLQLTLAWQVPLCDPDREVARFRTAMAAHRPLALVMGYGAYVGQFVIGEMSVTMQQTDGVGRALYVEAQVSLQEAPGAPGDPPPPGVQAAGAAHKLGSVGAAAPGTTGIGSAWLAQRQAAQAAMATTTAAQVTIEGVSGLLDAVRRGDAASLLARLPTVARDATTALPALGLSTALAGQAASVLGSTGDMAQLVTATEDTVTQTRRAAALGHGLSLTTALAAGRQAAGIGDALAPTVARLTPLTDRLRASLATRWRLTP